MLVAEGLYHPYSENKGADQLHVIAQLICVFVFVYAKNRFSHNEAHFCMYLLVALLCLYFRVITTILRMSKNEPRCEKTGLRGFRPGPTQTGLRNHRR